MLICAQRLDGPCRGEGTISFDRAIAHGDEAMGLLSHFQRMCDPYKGQSVLPVEREHQIDDLLAGCAIEGSGWFVRPDDGGNGRQGACNGKTLALASAHFGGAMPCPIRGVQPVRCLLWPVREPLWGRLH